MFERTSPKFEKPFAGFTLLEILIALLIFSIAMLAMSSLSIMAAKGGSYGGRMSEAVTFAQDKLEELKAGPWEKIVSGIDEKRGSTGITYTRNWKVLETESRGLKTVSIRVDWEDRTDHSISLFTVISQ